MSKIRLSKKELDRIKKLIKKGKSLNQINKITNKSKTTIYYHYKKLKGIKNKKIIPFLKNKELVGEFIGLFAGDGSVYITNNYHYRTYLTFNIKEKEFVKNLIENVLIKLFGKAPMIFVQENRLRVCYYSKSIHKLIKEYLVWDKKFRKTHTVGLKNKIYTKSFIIGFLRGNIDSDGYCSNKKIEFATVSKELMKSITKCLNKLKIKYHIHLYKEKRKNRKDIYHISIYRPEFKKFMKLIKPRNIKICASRDLNFRMF